MTPFRILLLAALVLVALPASAQIYAPEGANMPGSWSTNSGGGWFDPPALLPFAGILQPGGEFLLDTSVAQRRYVTNVSVQASGGDLTGGTYRWRFTSPSFGTPGGNKWSFNGAVIMDSVQNYNFTGGTADSVSVTLVDGSWYMVSYKDLGYVATQALWMRTSAEPRQIITVAQSPVSGSVNPSDSVQVSLTLNGSPSPEEQFFVRYSTNNFVNSTFLPVSIAGSSGSVKIPPFPGGTQVKYYALSTTAANIGANTDLKTLRVNNSNRNNFTYAVNGDTLTITATAGPNGAISPSGAIQVFRGNDQSFSFTPDAGYYVDSVIVDGILLGSSPSSYTFDSVLVNHTIRVSFTTKANVTFQVNMAKKMLDGAFRPDLGDKVTIRGSFNDWGNSTNNPDTLTDANVDSIYIITKLLKTSGAFEYKFWKTLRSGQEWEDGIGNRSFTLGLADTTLPVVFFNNEAFPVAVTFSVDMSVQMLERAFRPDSGDIVTVRGNFNDWGNTTGNPDTLRDPDVDSIYTLVRATSPGAIAYKFWKSDRGGDGYEPTIGNREITIDPLPTLLATPYFDNDSLVSVSFGVSTGWNMVSKPLITANDSVTAIFPGSALPYAFAFNAGAGYVQRSVLEVGPGYWAKFTTGQGVDVPGTYVFADTIPLAAGWNMVGSISLPVDTADVVQSPPGILASVFFGYNAGYAADTLIRPGKAYWVKASGAGALYLESTSLVAARAADRGADALAGMNSITLTDAAGASQTLWFGEGDLAGLSADMFDMPPAAPEGALDARFGTGRMVEQLGEGAAALPVAVNAMAGPVRVSWNVVRDGGRTITVRADGAAKRMSGEGSLVLPAGARGGLVIEVDGAEVPASYALEQNYPNPFNPATTIRYAIPTDARISVAVYDLLGRRIATLVDEVQAAGARSVQWNGRNGAGAAVASGVYFYRIDATPVAGGEAFTSMKKMMLLK
jgi:hypothetical protein